MADSNETQPASDPRPTASPVTRRRLLGTVGAGAAIAGAAIGVVAAGAAAGVAIERLTVGRGMRRKALLALDSTGPYGALRGTPGKAYADDGTELYYEVDDAEPEARAAAQGQPAPAGQLALPV